MIQRIVNSVFLDEQVWTKDGPATIIRAGKSVAAATVDSIVIAAVTGKKIRVIWMYLAPVGADTNCAIRTKPAGAGTDLGSPYNLLVANPPYEVKFMPMGYHETNAGEALAISTGAGAQVNINVVCVLV